MKKSKFSPTQIAKILKEFDLGKDVETISREYGVSKASLTIFSSLKANSDCLAFQNHISFFNVFFKIGLY